MTHDVLDSLERLIRTDPAGRGLIASEPEFGPLLKGHLRLAARDLADHATSVSIVTGFYIPLASPPAAETDGPLGAVLLAETLRQLGVRVTILTDSLCVGTVRAAAQGLSFPERQVLTFTPEQTTHSTHSHHSHESMHLSHLISVERIGPNHTLDSCRRLHPQQPDVWQRFEETVPPSDRDHCYNMRGICLDEWTAPLQRLFETVPPSVKTIGIGDGGNEIGMGSVPWPELVRRLPGPQGGKIACRVPCDWTILAGVSNWGAYALAAAVAYLRGRVDILAPWTCSQQEAWLQRVVLDGPAVDGVTRLPQPTVDGLPFATYIQPWDAMRQLLGLPR